MGTFCYFISLSVKPESLITFAQHGDLIHDLSLKHFSKQETCERWIPALSEFVTFWMAVFKKKGHSRGIMISIYWKLGVIISGVYVNTTLSLLLQNNPVCHSQLTNLFFQEIWPQNSKCNRVTYTSFNKHIWVLLNWSHLWNIFSFFIYSLFH